MAQFSRFEVYLPIRFAIVEVDPRTGQRKLIRRNLDEELVDQFSAECAKRFGGATRAHPMGSPPYRGHWFDEEQKLVVDEITYLFVLVGIDQFNDALNFFQQWKRRLERKLHQDIILITHWPVQVVGDLG